MDLLAVPLHIPLLSCTSDFLISMVTTSSASKPAGRRLHPQTGPALEPFPPPQPPPQIGFCPSQQSEGLIPGPPASHPGAWGHHQNGNQELWGRVEGGSRALAPASQWIRVPIVLPAGTGTSHTSGDSRGPCCQLHPALVAVPHPTSAGRNTFPGCHFLPPPTPPASGAGKSGVGMAVLGGAGRGRPAELCLLLGFSSSAGFLNKRPG